MEGLKHCPSASKLKRQQTIWTCRKLWKCITATGRTVPLHKMYFYSNIKNAFTYQSFRALALKCISTHTWLKSLIYLSTCLHVLQEPSNKLLILFLCVRTGTFLDGESRDRIWDTVNRYFSWIFLCLAPFVSPLTPTRFPVPAETCPCYIMLPLLCIAVWIETKGLIRPFQTHNFTSTLCFFTLVPSIL